MGATIELPRAVDIRSIEWAYKRAKRAQAEEWTGYGDQGMRAAKAGNPRLLLCLEKAANALQQLEQDQLGRTQRDPGATRIEQATQTPVALVREAYRLADEGTPLIQFCYIYAAFGELAGVVIR